ncbi:PhoH family protein [Clostridium sp. 'deep sea']|nr:PhoH family protein [Clostridium sp. 'deep sea']QOR36902.1 PhoH family protein [Clostridium sp. 'deep sea']
MDEMRKLFGERDVFLKNIEDSFHVKMVTRESEIIIDGENESVEKAEGVLRQLLTLIRNGQIIEERDVVYAIRMFLENESIDLTSLSDDELVITSRGKVVSPKTKGQQKYVESIRNNTLVFGVGPAGTGKTYLAIAMAVASLRNREVSRIVLTRPAVEAGERLGFLPGDLQAKIDPYLRPLYDALYDIMGAEQFVKYLEKGVIEVAPLAYMRGRTLDNSFVILDEAQNTTKEQMKMFLTRLGFGSQAIVTGDITQTDLPRDRKSGLKEAVKILDKVKDIGIVFLTEKDVVRHALVQRIIKAYEKSERSRKR